MQGAKPGALNANKLFTGEPSALRRRGNTQVWAQTLWSEGDGRWMDTGVTAVSTIDSRGSRVGMVSKIYCPFSPVWVLNLSRFAFAEGVDPFAFGSFLRPRAGRAMRSSRASSFCRNVPLAAVRRRLTLFFCANGSFRSGSRAMWPCSGSKIRFHTR